ncbi:hypothetical protein AB7813_08220 [Tardiphaga sp. 20_F10_N6_6]|uniref:hypothetical protein n=1 Tax=Tardiphaga sp. 20_F10_N6_6 TaxID=3240788 RepID=UPI003F89CCFD
MKRDTEPYGDHMMPEMLGPLPDDLDSLPPAWRKFTIGVVLVITVGLFILALMP